MPTQIKSNLLSKMNHWTRYGAKKMCTHIITNKYLFLLYYTYFICGAMNTRTSAYINVCVLSLNVWQARAAAQLSFAHVCLCVQCSCTRTNYYVCQALQRRRPISMPLCEGLIDCFRLNTWIGPSNFDFRGWIILLLSWRIYAITGV